jgi:tRNA C32,U32 (ribose-2'-O)-methylase TrmJ
MLNGRRSLNLANAAAVAVYEAWRQQGFVGAVTTQDAKRPEEQAGNQAGAV